MDYTKRCAQCGEVKPLSDFPKGKKRKDGTQGVYGYCRPCHAENSRSYQSKHPVENHERSKRWLREHPVERRQLRNRHNKKLREEVIEAYGHTCTCCGVRDVELLALHHVNDDGAQHRRETGLTGSGLYNWLKRQGWPKGQFVLLCHSCHLAYHFYGYCPHKRLVA